MASRDESDTVKIWADERARTMIAHRRFSDADRAYLIAAIAVALTSVARQAFVAGFDTLLARPLDAFDEWTPQ